jgi:hypothetical protein
MTGSVTDSQAMSISYRYRENYHQVNAHNQYNRIPECHPVAARGQVGRPLSRKVTPR